MNFGCSMACRCPAGRALLFVCALPCTRTVARCDAAGPMPPQRHVQWFRAGRTAMRGTARGCACACVRACGACARGRLQHWSSWKCCNTGSCTRVRHIPRANRPPCAATQRHSGKSPIGRVNGIGSAGHERDVSAVAVRCAAHRRWRSQLRQRSLTPPGCPAASLAQQELGG